MMFACYCLNITIVASGSGFQKVTPASLRLTEEEISDRFFKQDNRKVKDFEHISIVHSWLVKTRNIGSYTISRCINCDCHTHAVRQVSGVSLFLVYSKLLNEAAIESVKSSDLFSPIYKIIIDPRFVKTENKDTSLPSIDTKSSLTPLKDIVEEFIAKETSAVERRIQKYADEQYDNLTCLKDRACMEQIALIRVMYNADETEPVYRREAVFRQGNIVPIQSSSLVRHTETKPSILQGERSPPLFSSWESQKETEHRKSVDSDEFIFNFDSDVDSSPQCSNLFDSESDEEEVGVSIPRLPVKTCLAKSLPVNIPSFPRPIHTGEDDDTDASSVDEHVDIAASIKALAKSVHGEPVFGDLPRPRFSTLI